METEPWSGSRAPPTERGGNRRAGPTATAPHLDFYRVPPKRDADPESADLHSSDASLRRCQSLTLGRRARATTLPFQAGHPPLARQMRRIGATARPQTGTLCVNSRPFRVFARSAFGRPKSPTARRRFTLAGSGGSPVARQRRFTHGAAGHRILDSSPSLRSSLGASYNTSQPCFVHHAGRQFRRIASARSLPRA